MSDNNCENKKVFFTPGKFGGTKQPAPCDEDYKKIPEELREPKGVQETYTPQKFPDPITLYNLSQRATCDETYPLSEGEAVLISEGQLTDTISIQSIAGITNDVLTLIVDNNLIPIIESKLKARTLTASELCKLTGMQQQYANTFITLAKAKQEALDTAALELAKSQLNCLWWNDAQEAVCPDPEMASSNESELAVNRYVIPAHTVSSTISKEAANSTAYKQAESKLVCLYASDAITVNCVDRPNAPYENMEWVPTDPEGTEPRRVGTVTIPQGAYISTVSKEQANLLAKQVALSLLNCFYKSEAIDISCEDPDARNTGVNPDYSEAITIDLRNGNEDPGGTGQRVILPEGFFISDVSTADATLQARQYAESRLECCFINDYIHVECPEEADEEYSPVWEYSVEQGAFISCLSKDDANEQAWTAIAGIVQCIYCNDTVLPNCVPDWVTEACSTGILLTEDFEVQGKLWKAGEIYKLDLPLNVEGLINPYTREHVNINEWSLDATVGIAADTVCSDSLREVQEIAQLMPTTVIKPVEGVQSCTFESTRLLAGCAFADPYAENVVEPYDGKDHVNTEDPSLYKNFYKPWYSSDSFELFEPSPVIYYGEHNYKPYRIYKAKPSQAISAELSYPTPGSYIEFPAGLMQATINDVPDVDPEGLSVDEAQKIVREYLDDLVLTTAIGIVECKYGNPTTYVACAWNPAFPSCVENKAEEDLDYSTQLEFGDPDAEAWWYGEGKDSPNEYNEDYLIGKAKTTEPIIIGKNAIIGDIYQDVLNKVKELAASLLFCVYTNRRVTCSSGCPEIIGYNLLTEGERGYIPKGTIQAENISTATSLAREMLNCNVDCLYGNLPYTCYCGESIPANFFTSANTEDIDSALSHYCNVLCESVDIWVNDGYGACVPILDFTVEKSDNVCSDADENKECWFVGDRSAFNVKVDHLLDVEIPEGMFMSFESKEEANAAAALYQQKACETQILTQATDASAVCYINRSCIPCLSVSTGGYIYNIENSTTKVVCNGKVITVDRFHDENGEVKAYLTIDGNREEITATTNICQRNDGSYLSVTKEGIINDFFGEPSPYDPHGKIAIPMHIKKDSIKIPIVDDGTLDKKEEIREVIEGDFCEQCEEIYNMLVAMCMGSVTYDIDKVNVETKTLVGKASTVNSESTPKFEAFAVKPQSIMNTLMCSSLDGALDITSSFELENVVLSSNLVKEQVDVIKSVTATTATKNIPYVDNLNVNYDYIDYIESITWGTHNIEVVKDINITPPQLSMRDATNCPSTCLHINVPAESSEGGPAWANPEGGSTDNGFTIMINLCLCLDGGTYTTDKETFTIYNPLQINNKEGVTVVQTLTFTEGTQGLTYVTGVNYETEKLNTFEGDILISSVVKTIDIEFSTLIPELNILATAENISEVSLLIANDTFGTSMRYLMVKDNPKVPADFTERVNIVGSRIDVTGDNVPAALLTTEIAGSANILADIKAVQPDQIPEGYTEILEKTMSIITEQNVSTIVVDAKANTTMVDSPEELPSV